MGPLLDIAHDWHRARAIQRTGKGKPPPLVAAGLDLEHRPELGRNLRIGGMAIVFGAFPPSLSDLIGFAKARLFLQPEQARALDPVLRMRILALWAWLPGPRRDVYLEFDRATGEARAWLLGPDGAHDLDPEAHDPALDAAFLEGLVLAGSPCWGGEPGLTRLAERFGAQPLLVAARVSELIDRRRREPLAALALAHSAWPQLNDSDEAPWIEAVEQAHPWAAVQLGRLALRLGLSRAARVLLQRADATDSPAVAWFDLGQTCELLDDLPGALAAFVRYVGMRTSDADGWRRLLILRLRLGELQVAEEALRKYHENGGKDEDLATRMLDHTLNSRLRLAERAVVAGWLGSRLEPLLVRQAGADQLAERLAARRPALGPIWLAVKPGIAEDAARLGPAEPAVLAARADALGRTALLALPFLAAPHPSEEAPDLDAVCGHAQRALGLWCEEHLRLGLRWMGVPGWLRLLAEQSLLPPGRAPRTTDRRAAGSDPAPS